MSHPIEIVASLLFDSWVHHSPDLREGGGAENRHLIYEGQGVFLDLLIREMPDDQSMRVSGQILRGPRELQSFEEVSNLAVYMVKGDSRFSLHTNALGEFIFNSIPDGIWNLTIAFDHRQFVVHGLSAREEPRSFSV